MADIIYPFDHSSPEVTRPEVEAEFRSRNYYIEQKPPVHHEEPVPHIPPVHHGEPLPDLPPVHHGEPLPDLPPVHHGEPSPIAVDRRFLWATWASYAMFFFTAREDWLIDSYY